MGVWKAVRRVASEFLDIRDRGVTLTESSSELSSLSRPPVQTVQSTGFKLPPHERTTATTVDMFEKRPRPEERDDMPNTIEPEDGSVLIDTGGSKLTNRATRAMQLRQRFVSVSRTLTTPEKAATYFSGIGESAESMTHALAHFIHLMSAVYTWQYGEVWRLEKGKRVVLESYFLVVDPLEIEFGRVRRSLRRIGEHGKSENFSLPWEDVVGGAFQVGHCVRKVIRTPGEFGTANMRMLLMERAGVVRACAFPVRIGGKVTHTVALFDVYSDGFAAVEQSAFADFAIAQLSHGFDRKSKPKSETNTI